MRILLFTLALLPAIAFAQDAPMLVVDKTPQSLADQESVAASFPDWAVTNVARNSTGQNAPVPAAPAAAAAPAAPAPANPPAPATPTAPESPVSKLWPVDTVPIFVRSCIGFHPELLAPCTCTITELMQAMPHDEFLRLSIAGSIEQDKRVGEARYKCLGTPIPKQQVEKQ